MDLTLFFGVVLAPTSSFVLDQRSADKSTLNNHFIKKLDLAVHLIIEAWTSLLFPPVGWNILLGPAAHLTRQSFASTAKSLSSCARVGGWVVV